MKLKVNGKTIPGVESVFADHLYLGDSKRSALHLKLREGLTKAEWAALLSGEIIVGEGEDATTHEGYNTIHDCQVTLLRADDAERTVAELTDRLTVIQSEKEETQAALTMAQETQALLARTLAAKVTDDEALGLEVWLDWQPDTEYTAEEVVCLDCALYRVVQPHTSQAHQQPGSEGMLAIYRPMDPGAAGTLEDPIPFLIGMDVEEGKYYSYDDALYLAKADLLACHEGWVPGTTGMWQWEAVAAS